MPFSYKLDINKINIQAYADDIVALSSTSTGLQNIIHELPDFLAQHELLIIVEKTNLLCFKRGRNPSENSAKFFIGQSPIEQELRYKYLGSIITSNQVKNEVSARSKNSFNRSVGMFYRDFHSVDRNLKFMVFKSFCM